MPPAQRPLRQGVEKLESRNCGGALYADVKKCRNFSDRRIPLLASPQGGEAASSEKFCEATQADAAGVVFLFVFNRKTTPASQSAEASRHFIDRSATPPCGDARRGIGGFEPLLFPLPLGGVRLASFVAF